MVKYYLKTRFIVVFSKAPRVRLLLSPFSAPFSPSSFLRRGAAVEVYPLDSRNLCLLRMLVSPRSRSHSPPIIPGSPRRRSPRAILNAAPYPTDLVCDFARSLHRCLLSLRVAALGHLKLSWEGIEQRLRTGFEADGNEDEGMFGFPPTEAGGPGSPTRLFVRSAHGSEGHLTGRRTQQCTY